MNMNPIKWLEWLITEHGSASILRERLAHRDDRIKEIERQMEEASLKSADRESELEKNHRLAMARLRGQHRCEIDRILKLHQQGKLLRIPDSVLHEIGAR